MVAKRKTTTKKDLEEKIAELEEKLSKLSTQLEKPVPKPAETKPAKTKPAETKPAKTKPAETKPAKTKPAETKPAKRPEMFGSFSGQNMTVDGVVTQVQQQQTKPRKLTGTLPKGMEQPQTQQPPPSQQQTIYSSSEGKSRKDQLEEYEKDYLERIEQQRIKEETEINRLREEESKKKDSSTRGSLPKGFEPQPEPEAPKPSRGTLPKGF